MAAGSASYRMYYEVYEIWEIRSSVDDLKQVQKMGERFFPILTHLQSTLYYLGIVLSTGLNLQILSL